MSDIEIRGLFWALVALVTTGVAGLGLALQPLFVLVARRGKGASTRHALGAFLGPLRATILGVLALWSGESASQDTKATLDGIALGLPLVALAIWIGTSVALLRPRSS